jgi:predicted PurR-regulated permease PerM
LTSGKKWSPETKRFVFIVCFVLIGLAIWRFSILLAPLIVAVIIAYLLNPLVIWLTQRTRLSRDLSAAVVYVIFLSVLFLIPFIGTPLIVQQVRQLDIDVQEIADQLRVPLSANLAALDSELDVESFSGSVGGSLEGLATWVATVAFSIAEGFIWAIFIIVVGYYLLREANNFNDWVDSWIPPDFLDEFRQLRREIDRVWKSYFYGQVTLAIIVGLIVGSTTALLGIRSAVLLGLLAALLELIPNWGYGLSGAIGVLFAFFQGSSWIPLPSWAFALVVLGFYFLMWQFDTNYLIPRVIGHRLRLSPAIVIIGIIGGASLAGALGLLLAAPIIATVRVVGGYIYRRLLDLEPYVLMYDSVTTVNEPLASVSEETDADRQLPLAGPSEAESAES